MDGFAGGLDEFPPAFFAVDLPAGGTAVDGGSLAVRGGGVTASRSAGSPGLGMFTILSVSGTLGISNPM
ncbi:hypothetical protein AHiyo8_63650 [Arthrobacter sp. Hiyo8]|nr:hypothetical protein AHiyo8_63650 [Arthrobacter sp. Hiyo8]